MILGSRTIYSSPTTRVVGRRPTAATACRRASSWFLMSPVWRHSPLKWSRTSLTCPALWTYLRMWKVGPSRVWRVSLTNPGGVMLPPAVSLTLSQQLFHGISNSSAISVARIYAYKLKDPPTRYPWMRLVFGLGTRSFSRGGISSIFCWISQQWRCVQASWRKELSVLSPNTFDVFLVFQEVVGERSFPPVGATESPCPKCHRPSFSSSFRRRTVSITTAPWTWPTRLPSIRDSCDGPRDWPSQIPL